MKPEKKTTRAEARRRRGRRTGTGPVAPSTRVRKSLGPPSAALEDFRADTSVGVGVRGREDGRGRGHLTRTRTRTRLSLLPCHEQERGDSPPILLEGERPHEPGSSTSTSTSTSTESVGTGPIRVAFDGISNLVPNLVPNQTRNGFRFGTRFETRFGTRILTFSTKLNTGELKPHEKALHTY